MTIQDYASKNEGFIRLTTEEVRHNLIEVLSLVMFEGDRIVLQQGEEEVAAIIPIREFERLEEMIYEMKPGPYLPEEYEFYEDEQGIHCIYLDEVEENFYDILEDVRWGGEIFGLLPPENLGGKEVDIFVPGSIFMSIDKFWVPDYLIAAKKSH